jgi:catecholate siderophore receptor
MTNQTQVFEFTPGPAAENAWGFPSFLSELTPPSKKPMETSAELSFSNFPAKTRIGVDLQAVITEMLASLSDYGASAFALMGQTVRTALIGGVLLSIPLKLSAQDWTQSSTAPVKAVGTATPIPASSASAGADPKIATMPEVTVVGESYKPSEPSSPKFTAPLRDIPQSVSVVPQKVMQDQGATSLREVLQNVPGITQNAGEGGVTPGDNLNIRGFAARSDLYLDGVRDMGGISRDSFNIEQVEVVKGPSSTYAGRGSTGGTINMVSKSPKSESFRSLSLTGGSAEMKRGILDINEPIAGMENSAVRLNVMRQDSLTPGRDGIFKSGWGVAPSVTLGLSPSSKLTLSYYGFSQEGLPDYGTPSQPATINGGENPNNGQPAAVDPSNYYGIKGLDKEKISSNQASVRFEHQFNESLSLRSQLVLLRTDADRIVSTPIYTPGTYTAPDSPGTYTLRSHITQDEAVVNQIDLTAKFETAGVQHTLVTGLEASHEYSRLGGYGFGTAPIPDMDHPDPNLVYAGPITLNPNSNKAEANSGAAYASDTAKLSDQWEVSGGLRFDYYAPHYWQLRTGAPVTFTVPDSQLLSWRGGVVFKPLPEGSVYASVGTSFNPSIQALANDTPNISSGLAPEENRSYEFGTKWDLLDNKLSVTAAAFRTDKINARDTNPADPTGPQILAGEQRVEGIEVGVAGLAAKGWNIFAGYAYLNGEYLKSNVVSGGVTIQGKELPGVPPHSFSLWTTYDFPFGLTIGAGGRYTDKRFRSDNNHNGYVPAYKVFDAMVSYRINDNVGLRLNLYNLSDELYYIQPRYWVRGTPFSAILTTDFKL